MNTTLEPQQALALVPGMVASEFRIQTLSGGLTNRVYKLSSDDATFILRLNANHTDAFGLDRSSELDILGHASAAGLAPEIVHADVDHGILMLRYINGRVWTSDDLAISKNLESLADLLRSVHALPLSGKNFDAVGVASGYLNNLSSQRDLHEIGVRCKAIIECIAPAEHRCCCHNDVVAANVIESSRLMLLDWEYASDNDPLFDLASVIRYHMLGKVAADTLLNAYAGGIKADIRERLAVQIRLYGAMHWLWLASRQVLSANPIQLRQLNALQKTLGQDVATSYCATHGA